MIKRDQAGLEEGDRAGRRGPGDPDLRGSTGLMALKKYKPTSPGRRFMSVSTFEEITKTEPEKSADRADQEDRRSQRQRSHHDAPPRRRPQAPLPDHRLQAPQGRDSGQGRRDRVRPEPLGADRAAPLRGRREGVHPRARAARGRRDRRVRPERRHPARQRAAAREHPDRHARPQRRAEARAGRQDGALRRLRCPAGGQGRRLRECCACPPARCGVCRSPVARRSARSATSTTRTRPAARRAAAAGAASARRCAARR